MGIPLKSISGFPEKRDINGCGCGEYGACGCQVHDFNDAISQMETKEISFKRERLAFELYIFDMEYVGSVFKRDILMENWKISPMRIEYFKFSDYLISASSTILEVKNKEDN